MSRWIYKKEILEILKGKSFDTEEEMEKYVVSKLPSLLKIKPEQIDQQSVTTSFDGTLCNCADVVIRSDDPDFKKAILVIELKLTKSVDKFKNSDYTEAVKQLHKYCQDVRALYGILLTEETCFIYRYDYLVKDQRGLRVETDRIPNMKRLEDKTTREALFDFVVRKRSFKYVCLLLLTGWFFGVLIMLTFKIIFVFLMKIAGF
jgi:hypothetical protein